MEEGTHDELVEANAAALQGDTDNQSEITDEFADVRAHYEAGLDLTEEETDRIADVAVEYLRGILNLFGESHSSIDEYDGEEGELILDVSGGDLAVLIGRHGRTLEALQTVITTLLSSRLKFYYPIVVDIESYRNRAKKKIEQLARHAASRAMSHGSSVKLAPMNAYDRRLVHLALRNDSEVTTHSEGEDPNRYVVVTPVKP
ncbi:R3H domain-containing nucleic acid-binding protein [Olsenella sp. Marseille-P4559]|uniref:Jag family protein n=1 Tax=Olsenella sp. Marseille-P4559 TaxID=2364795 RepID=UPI00102FD7A6|nr:R3H domain-containing nucleic acid-binding protein [Olsenella sp. Marseille-P4559]